MGGHSKEPWRLGWQNTVAFNGGEFNEIPLATGWIEGAWTHDGATDESKANARRIVASVNATAGIPLEALETGCIAELVEAATRALNFIENTEGEIGDALESGDRLRATLAKVKGEAA